MTVTVRLALLEFSASRHTLLVTPDLYQLPMARLFAGRDLAFLRAMPGFQQRQETEFRGRRCRIFRRYLATLRTEMRDTLNAAEVPGDIRLRYQVLLAAALIFAFAQLLRYRWECGEVDLTRVIQRLESLRVEAHRWVAQVS